MPRKKLGVPPAPPPNGELAARLANELRQNRDFGQPLIEEEQFPSGKRRVAVIWDDWEPLDPEDRTVVILQAYEKAESPEYRDSVALASGWTFPEAHAAGMLPFSVFPAVRKSDAVDADQCRKAMIEAGASVLLEPDRPQLLFRSRSDADGAIARLAKLLPKSDDVWHVLQEPSKVDVERCL